MRTSSEYSQRFSIVCYHPILREIPANFDHGLIYWSLSTTLSTRQNKNVWHLHVRYTCTLYEQMVMRLTFNHKSLKIHLKKKKELERKEKGQKRMGITCFKIIWCLFFSYK